MAAVCPDDAGTSQMCLPGLIVRTALRADVHTVAAVQLDDRHHKCACTRHVDMDLQGDWVCLLLCHLTPSRCLGLWLPYAESLSTCNVLLAGAHALAAENPDDRHHQRACC